MVTDRYLYMSVASLTSLVNFDTARISFDVILEVEDSLPVDAIYDYKVHTDPFHRVITPGPRNCRVHSKVVASAVTTTGI